MLFRCRNSNEFPVYLCDAEGDSLLAACFGVDIREGLIDYDAAFLTEILEGLQVRQIPRCDLHANSPLIKCMKISRILILFCFVLENRFCHPCGPDPVGNVS